jgi:phage gpG-like protein
MGLTGDFRRLDALRKNVAKIAAAGFRREIGAALGGTAMKMVADGFRGERDPYGVSWEGLKLRSGKILQNTGRMRASANTQPTANGFRLSIPVRYAVTHQKGMTIVPKTARALAFRGPGGMIFAQKVKIPKRQMVPEASTGGLGPIWLAAFERTANALVRSTVIQAVG